MSSFLSRRPVFRLYLDFPKVELYRDDKLGRLGAADLDVPGFETRLRMYAERISRERGRLRVVLPMHAVWHGRAATSEAARSQAAEALNAAPGALALALAPTDADAVEGAAIRRADIDDARAFLAAFGFRPDSFGCKATDADFASPRPSRRLPLPGPRMRAIGGGGLGLAAAAVLAMAALPPAREISAPQASPAPFETTAAERPTVAPQPAPQTGAPPRARPDRPVPAPGIAPPPHRAAKPAPEPAAVPSTAPVLSTRDLLPSGAFFIPLAKPEPAAAQPQPFLRAGLLERLVSEARGPDLSGTRVAAEGETLVAALATAPARPRPRPRAGVGAAVRSVVRDAVAEHARVALTPRPRPAALARAADQTATLSQLDLIGVFGSKSHRRALVRMPDGEIRKLRAGDRVAGARVAALGSDTVRLSGGGRSVTLRMP